MISSISCVGGPSNLDEETGRARGQRTVANYLHLLRAYLGSLKHVGHDLRYLNSLRELVQVQTIDGLRELVRSPGATTGGRTGSPYCSLIAREYLKLDGLQVEALASLAGG